MKWANWKWGLGVIYSTVVSIFMWIFLRIKPATKRNYGELSEFIKQDRTIVHKGGVPENTIEGIKRSKSKGASAIEVDLQFTKDGHPVLLHDDTVDRTSNGKGAISDMTLDEVKSLDFGSVGCKIPTLSELIQTIKQLDLIVFLEIKQSNRKHLHKITDMFIEDEFLYQRIVIISFYPHLLYQIHCLNSDILVGLTTLGPMFAEADYQTVNERTHTWLVESLMLSVLTNLIPKMLQTSLVIVYKEDVFSGRVNLSGRDIIVYELSNQSEVQKYRKNYSTPIIVNENFYLKS